ncbi:MAG: sigma-54-dependent Fis family transcriptional regulator [Proteobacteria bacterium]|nr:sigma-54-dependent Fis family transcriptional regulator [Pseudomonadota bacterium]
MSHTILLVDDEPKLRDVLTVALNDMGYRTLSARSGHEAIDVLQHEDIDLVLTDLRMSEMGGRELLRESKRLKPAVPVVLMTAYSSVKDAVQAIKEGAFDYIGKPFEMDELGATLGNALRLYDAIRDNQRLRQALEQENSFDTLVGNSPTFREVIRTIAEVCESRANVLLTGESGTGKEMVARAIHYGSSRRAGPFVALNCAAIPEGLLETELFGHVKGAFTGAIANRVGRFAQADNGTLFLDEIGDMPMSVQAKILRVLQERAFEPVGSTQRRTVDVRIIAATNKDLLEAVRQKAFRDDLYYRLNVFPIRLPPLRQRIEDIPLLADHFGRQVAAEMGKRFAGFSEAALQAMTAYAWPGNIRELQNCVERAIIVARQDRIDVVDLPHYLFERPSGPEANGGLPAKLDAEIERVERDYLIEALRRAGGVQVKAAELLGISERSFWHRVKKYGINIVKQAG